MIKCLNHNKDLQNILMMFLYCKFVTQGRGSGNMKYDRIRKAVFIERPNRFIAHVDLEGKRETVHVKNTGRCAELLVPGTEVYIQESSLSEDNAADFTINNTGDAAWKIQLKQNNVELEKGQWYRLSLDAKASIPRELMFAIQRDGSSDDDGTPYSGEKIVELGTDYNKYETVFQMTGETDPKALLSISMGAVGGRQITEKHRICIDNINLEKIDAPDIGEQPVGENLLVNSDFSSGNEGWENAVTSPGAADVSFENGRAVYKISNVGTEDWNVQLKQNGIVLEQGEHYKVTFKAKSSEARTIKLAMLSPSYNWFGGEDLVLDKDQEEEFTVEFTMNDETETNASMVISMGAIAEIDTLASTVELSRIFIDQDSVERFITHKNFINFTCYT